MTNNLIIFSKNRACQLNLLLESLEKNSNGLFTKTSVLYTCDDAHKGSYDLLSERFPDVEMVFENDFKTDLLKIVKDGRSVFTTFMVDDAVLYGRVFDDRDTILGMISKDTVCFSLRLGLNCRYSHPADRYYEIKEYTEEKPFIIFDYDRNEGDFAYPLSTDGHIFKTNVLTPMLESTPFTNPNTLEANIQYHVYNNGIPKRVVSFITSKLVSVPVNLVNTTFNNRHGLEHQFSNEELLGRYLNGEVIDLVQTDFTEIDGPHKEIKYQFKYYEKC